MLLNGEIKICSEYTWLAFSDSKPSINITTPFDAFYTKILGRGQLKLLHIFSWAYLSFKNCLGCR